MKDCSKCKRTLSLDSFHKNPGTKDGLRSSCRDCKSDADAKYRKDNLEKVRDRQARYYSENKEVFFLHNSKRRARNREATPSWLTSAHKAHIKRTYKLASFIGEVTGVAYHVDHIVPLNGKNICGLNVPWNLQVLRADINLSKSNVFEGDIL
jgi:hypothetical protein